MYSIQIKNVKPSELDEVVRVEQEAWPEDMRAPREKFESRMKIFPDGFFGAYVDGKLVGISTSVITDYKPGEIKTWGELTGNGYGTTHKENGNTLDVVSLGVSQSSYLQPVREYLKGNELPGLGTSLMERQKELAKKGGLEYVVLVARVPKYNETWNKNPLSIDDYLELTKESGSSEPYDPEIRFYKRCGLRIGSIIPNAEEDRESRNYGIIMYWKVE